MVEQVDQVVVLVTLCHQEARVMRAVFLQPKEQTAEKAEVLLTLVAVVAHQQQATMELAEVREMVVLARHHQLLALQLPMQVVVVVVVIPT
jgi:hypothetical protein